MTLTVTSLYTLSCLGWVNSWPALWVTFRSVPARGATTRGFVRRLATAAGVMFADSVSFRRAVGSPKTAAGERCTAPLETTYGQDQLRKEHTPILSRSRPITADRG